MPPSVKGMSKRFGLWTSFGLKLLGMGFYGLVGRGSHDAVGVGFEPRKLKLSKLSIQTAGTPALWEAVSVFGYLFAPDPTSIGTARRNRAPPPPNVHHPEQ